MTLGCTEVRLCFVLVFAENADFWHPFSAYRRHSPTHSSARESSLRKQQRKNRKRQPSDTVSHTARWIGCLGSAWVRGTTRSHVCGCFLHLSVPFSSLFCDLQTSPMSGAVSFFSLSPEKNPRQLADLGSCNLNTRRPTYSLTNAVKITQERRRSEQNSSTFSTKLCTEGSLNAQKLSALFEK